MINIVVLFLAVLAALPRNASASDGSARDGRTCAESVQIFGGRAFIQSWDGACIDGARDGEGILESRDKENDTTWRRRMTFVAGQQAGLACDLATAQQERRQSEKRTPHLCQLSGQIHFLEKAADGTWSVQSGFGQEDQIFIVPGAVEAEHERLVAAARNGDPSPAPQPLAAVSPILEGLMPGGRTVFVPQPSLASSVASLEGKRVALLASSRMNQSFERLVAARTALMEKYGVTSGAASASSSGSSLSDAINAVISASDPLVFARSLVKRIRFSAAAAEFVPDLTRVTTGEFDYALVLDVGLATPLDPLDGYRTGDGVPSRNPSSGPVTARFSLGGIVLDGRLRIVEHIGTVKSQVLLVPCRREKRESECEERYLKEMASFFEENFSAAGRGHVGLRRVLSVD